MFKHDVFDNFLSNEHFRKLSTLNLKNIISSGNLVSDKILNQIVSEKILSEKCKNGFILDGYPRTIAQSNYLNRFFNENNFDFSSILNIKIDEKKQNE